MQMLLSIITILAMTELKFRKEYVVYRIIQLVIVGLRFQSMNVYLLIQHALLQTR